jgi:hypothetical protein
MNISLFKGYTGVSGTY